MVSTKLELYIVKEILELTDRRKELQDWLAKCPFEIYLLNYTDITFNGEGQSLNYLLERKKDKKVEVDDKAL